MYFWSGYIHDSDQGLLIALILGITPGVDQGIICGAENRT